MSYGMPIFRTMTSQQFSSTRVSRECLEAFEVIASLTQDRAIRTKAREAWMDCDITALRTIEREL